MAEGREGEAVRFGRQRRVREVKGGKAGIRVKDDRVTDSKKIFVFGSNIKGWHGAGAARDARLFYGATWGVGRGRQGQSYAIPTKSADMQPRSLGQIAEDVKQFLEYATTHYDEEFLVTRIGCGFAGFTDMEIAPLFAEAPANCELPQGWPMLIRQWKTHQQYLEQPPLVTRRPYGLVLIGALLVGLLFALVFFH